MLVRSVVKQFIAVTRLHGLDFELAKQEQVVDDAREALYGQSHNRTVSARQAFLSYHIAQTRADSIADGTVTSEGAGHQQQCMVDHHAEFEKLSLSGQCH